MTPYFLDTNIIMYSVGGEHPLRNPCRLWIEKIRDGNLQVVSDTEVLQEILYRYISLGRKEEAIEITQSLIELCEEIFPVLLEDIQFAMQLIQKGKAVGIRDAIHVATMHQNHIPKILSADHHFDDIPGIKRVDPKTA